MENKEEILREGLGSGSYLTRLIPRAAVFGGAIFKCLVPVQMLGWSEPGDYVLLDKLLPSNMTLVREFDSDDDAFEWGESRIDYDKEWFPSLGGFEGGSNLPQI